jgi:DNA ligase 1
MKQVIEIINKLENTSGTNDKIQILKDNKDNELLKKVLYYTYADNLQYGFSEKKLRELLLGNITPCKTIWDNGFDMLDKLASSNINDSLRDLVFTFLSTKSEEEQELYIRILTKDLRCNISAKSINKAIPKLIPTWEIQQGMGISKVKLKKDEWIALSLKLNGIRSTRFKGEFKSRQNKVQEGLNHIQNELNQIEWLSEFVIDGEMVRNNKDNTPDNENFRLTTSIMNSKSADKSEIIYTIFDLIPTEEFIKGESSLGFKDRLTNYLDRLKEDIIRLGLKSITVAPTYYTGTDHDKIEELLTEIDGQGYEGLMCLRDAYYKCKRHNGILKCKVFNTADCKIIGYEEGDGRLKGTLGSFVIDYKGNSVNVGSGYSDIQREEFWNNRDNYIGRILEVKYKEESKDKTTGLTSLQFPTFVCIREEGKEVSYN